MLRTPALPGLMALGAASSPLLARDDL